MSLRNLKITLLLIIVCLISASLLAETIYLNNRQYDKIDGQWYQIHNDYQFLVDESVITIKFKSDVGQSQKDGLIQAYDCEVDRVNILGFNDLSIPDGSDPLQVVQDFFDSGLVEVAEPNTIGEYLAHPNDTLYWDQWFHYTEWGIDSYLAWDKETGDPNVIIAILDSGTAILHEDLEGNIWVNPGED